MQPQRFRVAAPEIFQDVLAPSGIVSSPFSLFLLLSAQKGYRHTALARSMASTEETLHAEGKSGSIE